MTVQTLYRRKSLLHLVWPIAIGLLMAACANSETPATTEPSPPHTATLAATMSDRLLAEIQLSKYLRFESLTTEDGLSNNQLFDLVEDNYGFMWFASADGLNRYDGSSFNVYRNDLSNPNSISHNFTSRLEVDQSGNLWIGTLSGGLNQYDRERDIFIRYQHDPDDSLSLSNNAVMHVLADRAGRIWVSTQGGLNRLDEGETQFIRYLHDPDDPNSLSHDSVWWVHEDQKGMIWVGTSGGLDRLDPETDGFDHYRHDPNNPTSLSNNIVRSIAEDKEEVLWIGTVDGLNSLDIDREQFTRYKNDPENPRSLVHNLVWSVHTDRDGDLWIGTGGGLNLFDRDTGSFFRFISNPNEPYSLIASNIWQTYKDQDGMLWAATDGGVSILDFGAKQFLHYRNLPGDPDSLSNNNVRSLHVDQRGILWVGTGGGGLNKLNRQTGEFVSYQHDPAKPNSISDNSIRSIYEDQAGLLWVGTFGSGLESFDPDTERFTHYRHDTADSRSLSNDTVIAIHEDRTGNLWIGTWGGGLNKLDRQSGTFTRYQHDPKEASSLSSDRVSTIYEDRGGVLWIGTGAGLNEYHAQTDTFVRYLHDPTNPSSLVDDTVFSIIEDLRGTLWVGTNGGLDKFDPENGQFVHYTRSNGLPSNSIYGILEEDVHEDAESNGLWLSTTNGLSRFDPQTETFRNYDERDGLQGNGFLNFSAYSKSQDGEMFFGGTNGITAFKPDQILDNPNTPSVLITNLELGNRPVPIGGDSILENSILETDELKLSYQDIVISFEFAALNYQVPEKNRYKYKLEGFEDDWNEVDSTRRFATYTNLDPGDYVFRVIASNNDGVWNEEGDSVKIIITPPWYETTWFRIGLSVLVIGLLVGGYLWRVRRLEARSRELEAQIQLLFENSPVGIALSTYKGKILTFNKALLEMLRISEEELLREGAANFYANMADREELLATVQESGSAQRFGIPLVRKDGDSFYGSVNMSRLVLEGKEVLLVMAKDVSVEITTEQQSATHEERERLARDLHDAVTQTLFSASVLAQASPRMTKNNPDIARHNFERLATLIDGAMAEMRTLLLELRPSRFGEQSLAQHIELLVDSLRANVQAEITFNMSGDAAVPEEVNVAFYRIAQESLNNIARHAQPDMVTIGLTVENEIVSLSIQDDGRGFDSKKVPVGHFGLSNMREHAEQIGAKLHIDSSLGEGTLVNVSWLAQENDNEQK